jgi:hypothetical protein
MKFIKRILSLLGFEGKRTEDIISFDNPFEKESEPIIEIQEQIIAKNNPQFAGPTQYPQILKTLSTHRTNHTNGILRSDKGVLEDFFYDRACQKLGNSLISDGRIEFSEITITPDFIYADEEQKIFIVIEIDEPYALNGAGDFIPIHFMGTDTSRNKICIDNGWNVVRFSENQVALEIDDCIDFLLAFINAKESYNSKLNHVEAWSYEDALKMISEQFRNSYLPIAFQSQTKTNSGYSYRSLKVFTARAITSKKGENFIMLRLCKYWKSQSNEIELFGDCECWIPEGLFWEAYGKNEVGKIIIRDYQTNAKDKSLGIGMRFEAVGRINGNYFNLLDNTEFKITHPWFVIDVARQHGLSKSYMQILNEAIKIQREKGKNSPIYE